MDIVFDSGSQERPKGHALLYFRSSSDPEEIWVTYMVILPIAVDVSKYVPPFLINQVGELGPKDLSAFAFPPAPEFLGSYGDLKEMAALRDDDILFAGTVNPSDVPAAMMLINEVVQQYAEMYAQLVEVRVPTEHGDESEEGGVAVSEVLYGLMSEGDKLGELTKLVGRLRFSLEGSDSGLIREAEEEINLLARHLPANYNIPQLVQVVKSSDRRGAELAELYLQRCYNLAQEDYGKLGQVEQKIRDFEGERTADQG
jgi:hypothetical protein